MDDMRITIKNLEVFAHHGLLPEERRLGQQFLFDIGLSLKHSAAPDTDDVADTVDYAAVCDCVVEVATAATYNLLEKVAAVTADAILERFPAVDRVKVRVAKAAPPIPHPVGQIAVMLKRNRV
ncbi:MAG: dihydroneopterin aldolase [Thermoleophilia bacterium]